MKTKTITYLDKTGRAESGHCLAAAARRAADLKLDCAVVASSSGRTALGLARALREAGSRATVVGVGYSAEFAAKWGDFEPRFTKEAERLGAVFIKGTHAMGGINGAMEKKFGGLTPNKLVAQTYYTLGQGFKVAVEVALIAADQGLAPRGKEILALGGTGEGADTALVLTPACSSEFFDLRIHEVVCLPRRSGRKG
ncbi:MAG: pyruvate kinase alpha/beta domain-containing protein [Elusimicrobia bacterium]|nr:pyruvate kinase alpha/beta domain-containing protein [Elusimicrobiota bacterium]